MPSDSSAADSPQPTVENAIPRGRSRRSQEKGWLNIYNAARRIMNQRPDDGLATIVADLRELDISRKDPNRFYRTRELVKPVGDSILKPSGRSLDNEFYYPTVTDSKYSISAMSKIRYLLQHCMRNDTTAVMELGSGWSCNLFQLYIGWGATRSRKTIYYGGEYTDGGQRTAKYIARADDKLTYRGFRFDYRDPDVTFLQRQKGHILIFTTHSVEQVDSINPILFEQLRELEQDVTVVHFEPVGWQRDQKLLEARKAGDSTVFEELGRRINDDVFGDRKVLENAAWWSWRLNYNINLLEIVAEFEKRNVVTMKNVEYDYSGTANVFNPSSLIHYEFNR